MGRGLAGSDKEKAFTWLEKTFADRLCS